jgi:PAS domain S-box-containing protein
MRNISRYAKRDIYEYLIFGLALFFTYLSSLYSYLLFHSIAELFSIIISGGIFLIGWNTRKYIKSSFFLVLGVSFIFIGILDLLHTLAYSGMGVFPSPSTNLATQLWIAGRYVKAFSFVLALSLIHKKVNPNFLLLFYALLDSVLIALIFQGFFPTMWIEGFGLTGVKIASEYLVDIIFGASLGTLIMIRYEFSRKVFVYLVIFLVSTIISELSFTFYSSVFDFFNFIGHIFKIIAFYFVYKAIIETGLEDPFQLMFRKLTVSEKSLKSQTDHLKQAYSESDQIFNASLPLRIINNEFEVIKVNETFCDLFDISINETIGKKCYELFPHEYCDTDKCALKQIQFSRIPVEYEREFDLDNGRKVSLIVNSVPYNDSSGEFKGIIQNYTNISNLKDALEKIEDMAKFPTENPNPVMRISNNYVLLANKASREIFNVEEGSKIPPILIDMVHWAFSEKKSKEFEITIKNQVYSLFIVPIEDSNYANIYGMDITIREKAKEDLERFVSTVSHELRTPISVLVMSIELIKHHPEKLTVELQNQINNNIEKNIYLLKDLIEDILTLSRIDEQKIRIEWREYHPTSLITEILNLMQPMRKDKNFTFQVEIPEDLKLYGDPKRIDQVFRIFIDNAMKYSNDHGKIIIRATNNYIGNYNKEEKDGVLFEIIDEGIGISDEDLAKIFDRFYRSEQVSNIPGTGLGLAIAKELINLHNGDVYVTSELGVGTNFAIFLPRYPKNI